MLIVEQVKAADGTRCRTRILSRDHKVAAKDQTLQMKSGSRFGSNAQQAVKRMQNQRKFVLRNYRKYIVYQFIETTL
jgi:hypothetical protein